MPRLKASMRSEPIQRMMLQFIETVHVYQFPNWSRAEVEKMLQVTDISQTRVFKKPSKKESRKESRK